jgi:hypothetical protein
VYLPSFFLAALAAVSLSGADLSAYRGFAFGASPAVVTKQLALPATAVRTTQTRPASIQELDWRPLTVAIGAGRKPESVREGVLSFFNGELYRIEVTYDRYQIDGMTAEDVVDAISQLYGSATHPTTEVALHSAYGDVASVMARWEDARYSYDLVRTGDRASYALVMYSKALNGEAVSSMREAARLDALDAPQRELDRQNKLDAEAHVLAEKNRTANKPNFKP